MTSLSTYSLFAEDSPLAGAWLAANAVDKRLSKQSKDKIYNTPIKETTEAIEKLTDVDQSIDTTDATQMAFTQERNLNRNQKENKLPLRLSSQLLYGVVRIYSNKATMLHGEVISELKQINKIFTVNKNILMDPKELKLDEGLKDQLTVENLIDSVNEFNLDDVFGISQPDTQVTEDVWTNQTSSAVSDVDIGRNAADSSMVSSIDDVARRAEPERADDLDGVEGFELDLNFDKEFDEPHSEILAPDFGNDFDNAEFDGGFDAPIEDEQNLPVENTIASHIEEETRRKRRRRRIADKLNVEYQINNVVRTKSKKLTIDTKIDRTVSDVRRTQASFEVNLMLNRIDSFRAQTKEDELLNEIFKSLQPQILTIIGTNWRSIKKRRLENGNIERTMEETHDIPEFDDIDIGAEIPEQIDFNVPDFDHEEIEADDEHDVTADKGGIDETNDTDDDDEFEIIRATNRASVKVATSLRSIEEETTKLENVIEQNLLSNNKRKNATRTFFEMLVLATSDAIKLNQDRLFGEIEIKATPNLYQKFL